MKKILILGITFLLGFTLISCDEETEGLSRVTNFPVIEMSGDEIMFITEGSSFEDPGATATENEAPIEVKISHNVNADVVGVYTVSYSSENVDGFSKAIQRTVVVTPSNPNTDIDLTGKYVRTATSATANWKKVAPGVYVNDNVGGVLPPSVAVLPVYVFHFADGTISIPEQPVPNGYGTLSADVELNANGYAITVWNFGFATAPRDFVKQ